MMLRITQGDCRQAASALFPIPVRDRIEIHPPSLVGQSALMLDTLALTFYETYSTDWPKCSGVMRILAFIEDQEVIR
jgi:hypothetical protein